MIPQQAAQWAREAQARTGVSTLAAALALAVAGPESGWDPGAIGDYMIGGRIVPRGTPGAIPTSFGLTQLHTDAGGDGGGLGNGYPAELLLDPVQNLSIAMREIQARLNEGATAYGALQPWSARPQAMGLVDAALAALGEPGADFPRGMELDGAAAGLLMLLGIAAIVVLTTGG